MNLVNDTEKEAAELLRRILPEDIKIAFGRGVTDEGGRAPDVVLFKQEHQDGDKLKHSTLGCHAFFTKSYTYEDYWKFTLIERDRVHHNLAHYAPELVDGVLMAARKRPSGTEKNPQSINFGKADVDHAVYFKPASEDSVQHAVFYQEGEYTFSGAAIATGIVDHINSYGPFVIDVKGGALSQLCNVAFVAERRDAESPIRIYIDSSSLPTKTKQLLTDHVTKHLQEKIHRYLDDISSIVGRPVNSTKIRKYRNKINGVYVIPRDDLDIPEQTLRKVPFYHIIGTEIEAAEGVRLVFDRIATGYKIEEYNGPS